MMAAGRAMADSFAVVAVVVVVVVVVVRLSYRLCKGMKAWRSTPPRPPLPSSRPQTCGPDYQRSEEGRVVVWA